MTNFQKNINSTILPNDFLTEQAVLNILITNPNLIKINISNLKVETFYHEPFRLIYQTISEFVENHENNINLTLLISKLVETGRLKKIGGLQKIYKIIQQFENFSDLDEYIKILKEKYIRRIIIELGKQLIGWGYSTTISTEEIINRIELSLFNLNQQKFTKKIYSAAEVIDEVFQDMNLKKQKNLDSGYLTSFKELDAILQGFQKSDLIIVAGRPSMGKTAFSLNLAKNIVEKYQIPLVIFSLEMSRQQIIYRFLSSQAKINTNRLKSGKMTSFEWENLRKSMIFLSEMPLYIDDNPNLTLNDIKIKLKKIFTEKNQTGLIIIDYLQLMKLNLKLENRVQEISYLTRNLKILAKELNIPIILLSQLSRGLESRINKRPMLSDLRESGCSAEFPNRYSLNIDSWNRTSIISRLEKNFYFKGVKPIYLITLENGIKVELTENHKILSKSGWIKVSELSEYKEIYCLLMEKQKKTFPIEYEYKSIQKIEYLGLYPVYDKTIPIYHNYILNNLILHNSIEQDADIVIMLYREDYYNEKTKNNSQITEFIVAKHRNGPVGTAKLFFNPSLTAFTNFSF
uniref:Replicative DNA helicase n=1 Tax=Mallomonas splendens TaxID=52552 RepID=A0A3G2QZX0_9STRA|nr:replicative DNA helicase [Mallomonas splendens]AYO28525.1 replicative DNA helicase [Mallomonas splendens]